MKGQMTRPLLTLLLPALLLGGCASVPQQVILAPTLIPQQYNPDTLSEIDLDVVDNRRQRHLLQIKQGSEQRKLLSANRSPGKLLNQTITQGLSQQGYQLTPTANVVMTVEIEKMLINLNQETVEYQANNDIALKVIVKKEGKTLTKRFSSKGESHGPLKADVSVLERLFNEQLGQLINQLLNDSQIKDYLHKP